MRVDLITPAAGSLITPEEAQAFARAPSGVEADLWPSWILTALHLAQEWTGRQFLEATFERVDSCFPGAGEPITLAPAPLRSVASVTYRDLVGVVQTMDVGEYRVVAPVGPACEPGAVWPVSETWPTTQKHPEAVRVRFKAGYGASRDEVLGTVPNVGLALRKGVAECYARREQAEVLKAMVGELEAIQLPWMYS